MTIENARVRSLRARLNSLQVNSATIGCPNHFMLRSENISKTGMLLTWYNRPRAPFTKQTILEMNIDPEGAIFDTPLKCLGKVVRIIDSNKGRKYGIQIVQIDPDHQATWESMVENSEMAQGAMQQQEAS